MMFRITSLAAALTALAVPTLANAQTQSARSVVDIKNAYARIIYLPENRTDYVVTVTENGSDALPRLQITQSPRKLEIDGGISDQRSGIRISQCRNGDNNTIPESPGIGSSVTLSGIGRVDATDAPLLIIRGPLNADIRSSGAVYGTVTRGASNIDLRVGGCGAWVVANTPERLGLSIGGNAIVWAGDIGDLDVKIGGSGHVKANHIRTLSASMGGSGRIGVASIDGNLDVRIGGSGTVDIASGNIPTLTARIGGSGDIEFGGTVHDLDATIAGAGRITVDQTTGTVRSRVMGSGRINVNRQ